MREIISIYIGQYGIQSGEKFQEQLCQEHKINNYGKKTTQDQDPNSKEENLTCFFSESTKAQYVPRSIFVDLDPTPIFEIRKKMGTLLNKDCLVSGLEDSAGNCSKARYTIGRKIIDITLETIRKEVEKCDSLQGFMIHKSLSGGTGVGFGGLLVERLSVDYGKKFKVNSVLFPSHDISNEIVEPYNFVLSTHDIIEHSDLTIIQQNQALYDFCDTHLDIEQPDYSNLNKVISQIHSSMTSTIRFGGELNYSIPHLVANLTPYPRISLVLPSYSSTNLKHQGQYLNNPTSMTICNNAFKKQYFLAQCNPCQGKYLACSLMVSGDIVPKDIYKSIHIIKSKQNFQLVEWNPTGFKVGLSYRQPLNLMIEEYNLLTQKEALVLGNNAAICTTLDILAQKFDRLFAKRAFVHWFVGEGMESGEFHEAREDLHALLKDYNEVQLSDVVSPYSDDYE